MALFNIVIDPSALKDFKKVKRGAPGIFTRLVKVINSLTYDPFLGKALHGNKKGCYSVREGDYRIIYEIHMDDKMIHVIAVGHRKEIYR